VGRMNFKALRLSDLSTPRQRLVRLCQTTNYGHIQRLDVKDSEPIFASEPLVSVEVKLDVDEVARREVELVDFALPDEMCRLMARLDEIQNGVIERIEVRAGVPRRIVFRLRALEVPR